MSRGWASGALVAACLACPQIASAALSWSKPLSIDPHHKLLAAVSCPSVTQCTAVDASGYESTFAPVLGSASPVTQLIDPSGALGVACPSTIECIAVDTMGQVVTFNPTSPGKPSPVLIDSSDNGGYSLNWVACPSTTQCTAVDAIAAQLTFKPSDPGHTTNDRQVDTRDSNVVLNSVACPSTTQCTGVDSEGYEVTFKPSSSETFLKGSHIDPHGWLNSVACPSATQCTAVDRHGYEVTLIPARRIRVGCGSIPPASTGSRVRGAACA